MQFFHRIDSDGVIKVTDFGLTEDMYGTNYFRRERNVGGNEEKVPIRWMAPESIEADLYDETTDVVSLLTLKFFPLFYLCHTCHTTLHVDTLIITPGH